MDIVGLFKNIFASFTAFFRLEERKNNEEAGANKVKVAQNEKLNKIRKNADRVWDKPGRDRLHRD